MKASPPSDPRLSVDGLCDHGPWPRMSPWVFLYLPFGALLLVLRVLAVAVLYGAALAVPALNRRLYRLLLACLGIRVRYNLGPAQIREYTDGCVVAANHVSAMDTLTVLALPNVTIMVGNPLKSLNPFSRLWHTCAFRFSGAGFWMVADRRAFATHLAAWRESPRGVSLYTTPEMTIGNQRGLFHFNTAFVCLGMPVVPLTLTVENDLGMNHNPVDSSGLAIFLRLLMLPRIVFRLDYLEKAVRAPGESKEAFARRVQDAIAAHLDIPATHWTAADKHAYRKRIAAKP